MSNPESSKSKAPGAQASSSSASSNQSYAQFLANEAARIAGVAQEEKAKNTTTPDRVSGHGGKKSYSSGQCAVCGEVLSPGHGHT